MHQMALRLFAEPDKFNEFALALFRQQWNLCAPFREFARYRGITSPDEVQHWTRIPFLPVEFFKSHDLRCGDYIPECWFESSSTTGNGVSRFPVQHLEDYQTIARASFEYAYGSLERKVFLCLLPSYLERQGSSLVAMLDHWVNETAAEGSGFFLYNHAALHELLLQKTAEGRDVQLWGVTFALLDFADYVLAAGGMAQRDAFSLIETGGMKGRRAEITRYELHEYLSRAFNLSRIGGEYGMTELSSQAYARERGFYQCPPQMKVCAVRNDDPFTPAAFGKTGRLCVADLGSAHACAFIMTSDAGRVYEDGSFEVLGRLDYSDLRGCNLMAP
jgi:hypothetical protein